MAVYFLIKALYSLWAIDYKRFNTHKKMRIKLRIMHGYTPITMNTIFR